MIGDYLGTNHYSLLSSLKKDAENNPHKTINKILWGGEIEFQNTASRHTIVEANQSSGTLYMAMSGKTSLSNNDGLPLAVSNDINELASFTNDTGLEYSTTAFDSSYDENKVHLLAVSLKNDSIRHYLGNKLGAIHTNLEAYTRVNTEEKLEILNEVSESLDHNTFIIFGHLKKMYSNRSPKIMRAIGTLEYFHSAAQKGFREKNPQKLNDEKYLVSIKEAIRTLNDAVNDSSLVGDTQQTTLQLGGPRR